MEKYINTFYAINGLYDYSPYKGSLFANYANDAAAAAGGIVLGGWYRNGSIVQQRVVR